MVNCVIACFLHRSVYVCVCGFVWVAYVFAPVCVCVHVCMCVSLRDGDCMHTSLHLDNCVCVFVGLCGLPMCSVRCVCVCMFVCMRVGLQDGRNMHTSLYRDDCVCVCVCVHGFVCVCSPLGLPRQAVGKPP